tara:strand:- start:189 stop:1739 length:1551 start_codon:yes stop_codon:yes gene_type:complete
MTNEEAEAHFLSNGFKEGRSMYEGHNPDEDVLPEALYIERHGLFKYMQGFSKNSLSVLVKFHKGLQNGLSKQGKTLTDIVQKVEEEAKIATGAVAKENDGEEVASKLKSEELVMPQKYEGRCGNEYEIEDTYSLDNTAFKCDFNGLSEIERDEMIDAAYAIMETDPDYFSVARMAIRRSMKNNSTEEKVIAKQTADDAFSMTAEDFRAAMKKVAKKETVKPIIVLNHELQNNRDSSQPVDLFKRYKGTINYTFVPPSDNKKIISNLVANAKPKYNINNKNGLKSLELVNLSKFKLQLNDKNQEVKLSTVELLNKYKNQKKNVYNYINQNVLNEFSDILECVSIILKYEILIDPKKINTINWQGLTRTTYSSNQGLTIGSAKFNKILTGEVGYVIPSVFHDIVLETTNIAYGGESPFNKRETRDLASKSYEDLVKMIDDPNIEKAKKISADQIQQIQRVQKEIKVSSQKNKGSGQESSGGLAEETSVNTGEDHHPEEKDPGPAPGDPGDRYSSGIGG